MKWRRRLGPITTSGAGGSGSLGQPVTAAGRRSAHRSQWGSPSSMIPVPPVPQSEQRPRSAIGPGDGVPLHRDPCPFTRSRGALCASSLPGRLRSRNAVLDRDLDAPKLDPKRLLSEALIDAAPQLVLVSVDRDASLP